MDTTAHAASFGRAAREYDRGRPSYPREAVSWLVPETATAVVDVGAGTGKFTQLLRRPGRDVFAVDPAAEMLAILQRNMPDVTAVIGSAESVPLPDSSMDAAVLAQAWHWADASRALPELARVLRPGGQLSMVWNVRDPGEPWVAELDAIIGGRESTHEEWPSETGHFTELERREFSWLHSTSPEGLLDMVASRSYVIVLPEAERRALLNEVRELTDRHFADGAKISVPYRTVCWRTYAKPTESK